MDSPLRTSRLAVFALLLALLPGMACLLLVMAAVVFPDSFNPAPGHYSVLYSPAASLLILVVFGLMLSFPVALVTGIISLVRISRRRAELKGAVFVWIGVALSACYIILCILVSATPVLLTPFILQALANPSAAPADGGVKIVFASNRYVNYEIFSMNPDGSGQTRLTILPSDDLGPACSPDGRSIIFWAGDRQAQTSYVWSMRRDGSSQTKLGQGAGRISFSPDGQDVTLNEVVSPDGKFDIVTVKLASGQMTRLTTNPADDTMPDWSHDGKRIAFTSDRDGINHIYLMNADGTDQKRLTTGTMEEYGPEWSPDGNKIAFWSGDPKTTTQIYLVNADGTQLKQMTDTPGLNDGPAWSPDGTRLAFSSRRLGNRQIYTVNIDGTGLVQLTTDPGEDLNPCWLPGKTVELW